MKPASWFYAFALAAALPSMGAAEVSGAKVERAAPDSLHLTWTAPGAVDLYEADKADAPLTGAHLLARGDRDGAYTVEHAGRARRYFILVDPKDHKAATVAERVVPLAAGSNFRDIGGYVGAVGKHVRWGLIYRSGGQPMLTAEDVAEVKALGLAQLVDLRSSEERVMAPSKITGVPYTAIGYSLLDMMGPNPAQTMRNGVSVYHPMPTSLAPQLRLIFADLLHRSTPLAYNCSAGQDRTGFATAMILSALGVSRDQILADYHLSTLYRRPEYEMPKLDAAAHPSDPVVQLFAQAQQSPAYATPQPLRDAAGTPYIQGAFDEIESKWGSVDGYLRKEIGLTAADIATLRRLYLE